MTDRELIQDFRKTRSPAAFKTILEHYLPFVQASVARRLGPHSPAGCESVITSVFEVLAFKLRRLPKKTALAPWLFRVASIATKRYLKLNKISRARSDGLILDEIVDGLPPRLQGPLIVRMLQADAWELAGKNLRIHPKKVKSRLDTALKRLVRKHRKRGLTAGSLGAMFMEAPPAPALPDGFIDLLLEKCVLRFKKPPKDKIGDRILTHLTWLKWRRRIGFAGKSFATAAAVLGLTVAILVHFWNSGTLLPWVIETFARRLSRLNPELAYSPKPWQPKGAPLTVATVRSSEELYRITNVWEAQLRFTKAEWEAIRPNRVKPVPKLVPEDGNIVLRNTNAHRSGLAAALGIDFVWTQANLEFGGKDFAKVGARYKGNGTYVGSLYGDKQSFKIDLNRLDREQNVAGITTLNFANMVEDYTCMRDALAYELFRDAGVPAPRTAYAWLRRSIEGTCTNQPLGLYLVVEALDAQFAQRQFGSKKAPIMKPVTPRLFEDMGNRWDDYAATYDLKTKATDEQKQKLVDFCKLVSHAKDEEFQKKVGDYLDLTECANFVACITLLSSYDGFLSNGQNLYIYMDPRSNKLGIIPWDLDHSWGVFPFVGTSQTRPRANIMHPWSQPFRFMERVMATPAFREIYRARMNDILAQSFNTNRLYAKIDTMAATVRDAVHAESDFRSRKFEIAVSNVWAPMTENEEDAGPKGPARQLKKYIAIRERSVRAQLDGKTKGFTLTRNAE